MANTDLKKLTFAGFLISIGIVFGDIGTSPLYTYSAILHEQQQVTELLVLGAASAIFWTLFFQTTVKYVLITLRADNKGEGGIFSLYALIRRYRRWLILPAIAGGAFLLADSIITPPISVSSAIEGLKIRNQDLQIGIVLAILAGLFLIQRKGTSFIGKLFGPVMLGWFTMIGALGVGGMMGHFSVLKALNPWWAYRLLTEHPGGFWLLGGVFLCTTGAEALYSDLGHCGRKNIQVSWLYVKTCLVLSYFGQAAWLMRYVGKPLPVITPFFGLVPDWFYIPAVIIATLATIIASQALISGSFTLVSEAIRLNVWPKFRVVYPSDVRGQIYIPAINWFLMAGCTVMVLHFRESKNMEAAFGLSVTLTMLMTTILLSFYLYVKKVNRIAVFSLLLIFLFIEGSFLVANLKKFPEGGWISMLIGSLMIVMMYVWYRAREIRHSFREVVSLEKYIPILKELSNDLSVPKYATNLIYLTASPDPAKVEGEIIHSIFYKQPKRADIYWFIHIETVDEPYHMSYKLHVFEPEDLIRIDFKLGFRVPPRINLFFRKVVEEMVAKKEVNIISRYASLDKHNITGDFRFVIMQRFLSFENELSFKNEFILKLYFLLKKISLPDEKEYGLDYSNVTLEKTPLIVSIPMNIQLTRDK